MDKKKVITPPYERIGILELDEVFHYIKKNLNIPSNKGKVYIKDFYVNVQSIRLRTFLNTGVECPCCGLKASFFAVERSKGTLGGYHLNLYGIDENNNEVLFTHDHVLARGLGGEDTQKNTHTMCGPCNWSKGHIEEKIAKKELDLNQAEVSEQLNSFYKKRI